MNISHSLIALMVLLLALIFLTIVYKNNRDSNSRRKE